MRRYLVLASLAILSGCSSAPQARYEHTYKIAGAEGEVDGRSAEQLQIAAANSTIERAVMGTVTNAFKLVRAPQPVMSPEDIENRVTGEVVALIVFSESGEVESVAIVESSKESLSSSVRQAVQQWRIAPPTAAGKPTKMRIGQVFSFRADW
jgi:TonB family protein